MPCWHASLCRFVQHFRFKSKHLKLLLYFVGYQTSRFDLVDFLIKNYFHRFAKVDGLAEIKRQLTVETEIIRGIIGQQVVHALVPTISIDLLVISYQLLMQFYLHGNDDRTNGICLVKNSTNSPFKSHALFLHVHFALGKDVHPIALLELLYAEIDGWLVHSSACEFNCYR